MAKRNFLLGKGERLTTAIQVQAGGGPKIPPYTFEQAIDRLDPILHEVTAALDRLPAQACPDDTAVATLTLNPEYTAKSYFPVELLRKVGLEAVGSRTRRVTPEKRSRDRVPEPIDTTELFLRGTRTAFRRWAMDISDWQEGTRETDQLAYIENIEVPTADEKVKKLPRTRKNLVFEVVLHGGDVQTASKSLEQFNSYLHGLQLTSDSEHRFMAGGLCFVEVEAPAQLAKQIAQFSLVRVMRQMPGLRLLRPAFRTSNIESARIALPKDGPLDTKIRVAIFDGGLPKRHPLTKWAKALDAPGVGPAADDLLEHGAWVTSAFILGHIDPKKSLSRPYSGVDHWRVVDALPDQKPFELFRVLERIQAILKKHKYEFINISLGPSLPIEDDEVHAWTAVLDELLCKGDILATIAVGNDGEGDPKIGANRVQVPSDCVNALAIGACDDPDDNWQRAPYSSVGPGRSPGLVKPDLLEFGGSVQRPFLALNAIDGQTLIPASGTSFAAPIALRMATGIRAHFGSSLTPIAIKGLLIHCAEKADFHHYEVGWGRVARTLEQIVVCDDTAVRIVFQGMITAAKYVRAPIPIPNSVIDGRVTIRATICYATSVDAHHPGNYTQSGLELTFRPHSKRFASGALHPMSKSFFGKAQKGMAEGELRKDAWKWENCQHASHRFSGASLNEPVFDIHYNARVDSHNDTASKNLNYALIITIEAPKIKDFYDQVVRKYATQLETLQPVIDIPVRL